MHERGYTFVGDTSFYRLTYPELRTLRAGFEVDQQLREDNQNGVSQADRANLQQFSDELQAGEWREKHGVA